MSFDQSLHFLDVTNLVAGTIIGAGNEWKKSKSGIAPIIDGNSMRSVVIDSASP